MTYLSSVVVFLLHLEEEHTVTANGGISSGLGTVFGFAWYLCEV